jgi:hypothetical protein
MLFLNFKTFLHLREDAPGLGVKTLTVAQIADKHGVAIGAIEKQLEKGIKVEREHTKDDAIAREIALDHLAEFPDYYDRLKKVEEDAPANAAGGGHVAGLGIGPQGEPGVQLPRRKKHDDDVIAERADTFANADVFDVSSDAVFRMRGPKLPWQRFNQFVGEEPNGEAIRQHARKQWSRDIILRDSRSGAMTYLRRRTPRRVS